MISTRVSDLRVTIVYTDMGRWFWTVDRVATGVDVNLTDAITTAILTATRHALAATYA